MQARATSPSITIRGGDNGTNTALLTEVRALRDALATRGVEITQNFAVAELGRAAEAVAMANRRAAALGLFSGGRSVK
ncbi:hypothetical protein Pdca_27570 [Pseudonocardia autotrophica]|nr:hypothetical protein Pdca_27570 [Pseudonocardia autotrophica]